jgi:thiol-disulfide isomerase/thioredoxin
MKKAFAAMALTSAVFAGCANSNAGAVQEKVHPAPQTMVINGNAGKIVFKKVKEFKADVAVYEGEVKQGRIERKIKIYKVGDMVFIIPWKLQNGRLVPNRSAELASKPKVVPLSKKELAEFNSVVERLKSYGVKYPDTGKPKLYVIFDTYCPFCKRAVQSGKMKELLKKYDLVLIPLNVHGAASVQENACLIEEGTKKPMTEVVKEWFSGKLKKCVPSKTAIKVEDEVTQGLIKLGLNATPIFVTENGKVGIGKPPASVK